MAIALDVDVLAGAASEKVADAQEQRRPSGATAAEHDGNARRTARSAFERGQHAPLEGRTLRNHHCPDPPAAGMSMPKRRAVSIASG